MNPGSDFIVQRDDLHSCEFVPGEDPGAPLEDGHVRLCVEKFALTANNVTYAVYGDAIGYWGYYPTPKKGSGRPPVWGFGRVVASTDPQVEIGARFYGFYPISSYVTMKARSHAGGFKDVSAHRQKLPKAYNQYAETTRDPVYDAEHEDQQMILRPLFVTSFLASDFILDHDVFGADCVVISSASSKTSYGIAHQLSSDRVGEVIGLTSKKNRSFTEGLGCYDSVFTYEDVASLPASKKVLYVDVAGSARLWTSVAERLGDDLCHAVVLGDTHWKETKDLVLRARARDFFFAPDWLSKRTDDWGVEGYVNRLGEAWKRFVPSVRAWMEVTREWGPEAIKKVWTEHLDGAADPAVGNVLSLFDLDEGEEP